MPYDPSTMTQIDIDDHEEQLEAQLAFVEQSNGTHGGNRSAYGSIGESERKKEFMWLRLAIFGIPIVVGTIIGLGVFFASNDRTSSSANAGDAFKGHSLSLPNPPKDLPQMCGDEGGTLGNEPCERACEVSECCQFPPNLGLSCLAGNEHNCLIYHKYCYNYYELPPPTTPNNTTQTSKLPQSIPPAPLNLLGICATNNLATQEGYQECQQACSHAACCYSYTSGDGCQHDECTGYAPCLTLQATAQIHPSIPLHIQDKCRASSLISIPGREACRQVCSHALCCFLSDHECPKERGADFCLQYESCNSLEKSLNVIASSEEIAQNCEHVPLHKDLCDVSCERGQCCFRSEGCDGLFDPEPNCGDYQPCQKLYDGSLHRGADDDDTGSTTQPPSNTAATTVDETVGQDDEGDKVVLKADVDEACLGFDPAEANAADAKCTDLCADKGCCFDKTNGCTDASINCQIYEECDVIYETDNNEETATMANEDDGIVLKADVDEACLGFDPAEADAAGAKCTQLCADKGCCFDKTNGCTDKSMNCEIYEECDAIYDKDDDDEEEISTTETSASSKLPGFIMNACEVDSATRDIPLCESLCENGHCCHEAHSCLDSLTVDINCEDYVPCQILYDTGTVILEDGGSDETTASKNAEHVQAACQENQNMELCGILCEPGNCCDAPAISCPEDIKCGEYIPCQALSLTVGEEYTWEDVRAACSGTAASTMCHTICQPAKCCFPNQQCTIEDGFDCDKYEHCSVAFDNE